MGRRTFDWRRWIGGALILATSIMAGAASTPAGGDLPVAAAGGKAASTADHSRFKELQGPFESGPEVTKPVSPVTTRPGTR